MHITHTARAAISLHGEIQVICECGRAIRITLDGEDVTIVSGHEVED